MPSNQLDAALDYARLGWRVFPVHSARQTDAGATCSCGKAGCGHVGKHPRTGRGFKDATTDEATIREWWGKWPDANIGIATGAATGFVVLDIDPRNGGDKALEQLVAQHGALPPTVVVETGGGGQHYFFTLTGLNGAKNGEVVPGIDFKTDGGYVVAVPSTHASGRNYGWREGCEPGRVPIADAPVWLRELVLDRKRKSKKKQPVGKLGKLGKPSEGGAITTNRNVTLTSIAGGLRRRGMSEYQMSQELMKINQERCVPPLDSDEVGAIVRSVANYPAGPTSPYEFTESGIEQARFKGNDTYFVTVANFHARIVRDRAIDDGVEVRREYEIEARVCGTQETAMFVVPQAKFETTSWWGEHLGATAVVFPGFSNDAHLRAAIRLRAMDAERVRCYVHTGWRSIGEEYFYLHGGGGIGASGNRSDIHVSLDGPFQHYRLPSPPPPERIVHVLRELQRLRQLAPDGVMVPLMAAPFAAVLGNSDFSFHVSGYTGTFKSETASIIQSFFGSGFTSRTLPGSWSSTANAIEEATFLAKDALVVIDDFKPSGDVYLDSQLNHKADRVFRAVGNGLGRGRMARDGTLRAPRPPRCLVLSTGEDVPNGQSLRARICLLELKDGDVNKSVLTHCQKVAAEGVFAEVLAAFCQWAAPGLREVQSRRRRRCGELREKFQQGHGRLATTLADLLAVWEIIADFIVEAGQGLVLSREEVVGLIGGVQHALSEIAQRQAAEQSHEDPGRRFIAGLQTALGSGKAHVASLAGGDPSLKGLGWREEPGLSARPMGTRIGWTDGEALYLDPTASYTTVNEVLPPGQKLPYSETTLRKRLSERGLLTRSEEDRNTLTVRIMLEGLRRTVLQLSLELVRPDARGEEIPV